MSFLNRYQIKILRHLLFNPDSRFRDLNASNLTSDHLSYYIKSLKMLELISRNDDGKYNLTAKGKEYANTMDTDKAIIEKQPKVAVLVFAEREFRGKRQIVLQKRLKNPYYGFEGCPTGKVRYGETINEAAKRELKEETGLTAEKAKTVFILHEHVYNPQRELLEDKIFHVVKLAGVTGKLGNFEGGENKWINLADFPKVKKKFYSDMDIYNWYLKPPKEFFVEKPYEVDEF